MTKVRSLFISDVHLGSRFSQSQKLWEFLKEYECEYLYLVGDFIDGWKLKNRFYWRDKDSFVLRRILGMIQKYDTKVFYITGNHDEFLRDYTPLQLGHISIVDECFHTRTNGERLLVVHGDKFDTLTKHMGWLIFFGDWCYTMAMHANVFVNWVRRKLGLKYYPLSQTLKHRVKQAINFINNFERFLVKYAHQKNCTGVVCGHIHTANAGTDIGGITYYNCGDWVESRSALVEHEDGRIELL